MVQITRTCVVCTITPKRDFPYFCFPGVPGRVEAAQSNVVAELRRGGRPRTATVVRPVVALQPGRVQADGHHDRAAASPAAERRVSGHFVRAARARVNRGQRPPRPDHRGPGARRARRHPVRVQRADVHAVVLRGPQAAADVLVRRHGAVLRAGHVHVRGPGYAAAPVVRPGLVGRHDVRVQQLARRARVPVDVDLRTAVHAGPCGRRLAARVLRLCSHVRRPESVPVRARRALLAQRVPRLRPRVPGHGRLRARRRPGNVGQDFPRDRGPLYAAEQQELNRPVRACPVAVRPIDVHGHHDCPRDRARRRLRV